MIKFVHSKEEMLKKAYELGEVYEARFGGCAPGSLLACMEIFGITNEEVYKASTGFSGGLGVTTESQCGALTGGLMFLGMLFGRSFIGRGTDSFDFMQYKSFSLAQKLKSKFEEEYGSFICGKIHESKLGRHYQLDDQEELKDFMDAGCRPKCAEVVGLGAQWAVETALDELAGLKDLESFDDLKTIMLYTAKDNYKKFLEDHKK